MDIQIQPQYVRASIIFVIIFFVFLTSLFGFRAGRDLAKSRATLNTVHTTLRGFDYFFSDQDRYPSPVEFLDPNILGVYLSPVPGPNFASKQCPTTTTYDTFDQRSFVYTYCLPRALGDQAAGLHTLTERDIPTWK